LLLRLGRNYVYTLNDLIEDDFYFVLVCLEYINLRNIYIVVK